MIKLQLDAETLEVLKEMDKQLDHNSEQAIKRLQIGVVAVLTRSGDAASMAYLREIWDRDPERREAVAMGLAEDPRGENWNYLVRTLPVMQKEVARSVMAKMATIKKTPDEAEPYRQVILKGLILQDDGAKEAIALLEHWTGESRSRERDSWKTALLAWQKWYERSFPDTPPPNLPVVQADNKWHVEELLNYLSGDQVATASADRGKAVFTKAQCIKCHRFGGQGEILGPDLSTVSKRFTRKEILESIIFPSHVISDQFASKTVVTKRGRRYEGIVAPGVGEIVVLQSDGQKIIIPRGEIDQIRASKKSSMPEGLLNSLTLEEVADLFAYMGVTPRPTVVRRPKE